MGRRLSTVDWTVFYLVPEEVVDAGVWRGTTEKVLFAGGVLVGALVIGALFSGVLLSPIDALSAATNQIARESGTESWNRVWHSPKSRSFPKRSLAFIALGVVVRECSGETTRTDSELTPSRGVAGPRASRSRATQPRERQQ